MLMDITSPAELLFAERAQFSGGRGQAYLTFLNESDRTIAGITGLMTLLGDGGAAIAKKRLTFDDLSAPPGERFVCQFALDAYPSFADVEMIIEGVAFADGNAWALNPGRLVDATPPVLPDGPERVALIALSGHDAVCYPERRDTIWVCVCGRFNRSRWLACKRCGRERDATLETVKPEKALSSHAQRVAKMREADKMRMRAEQRQNIGRNDEWAAREQKEARAAKAGVTIARALLMLLVAVGLALGIRAFLLGERQRMAALYPESIRSEWATFAPIDYLRPL